MTGATHIRVHGDRQGRPGPLAVRFDQAEEALGALPRLLLEPDGSFVWRGVRPAPYQWDGELYEGAGGLLEHVELRGGGPAETLQRLLAVFAPSPDLSALRLEDLATGGWLAPEELMARLGPSERS